MVDRMNATPTAIEELRDYLVSELDPEELAAFDAAQELWESGELPRMIEKGDFSELPTSVRPD
jgi:hypothetical protein